MTKSDLGSNSHTSLHDRTEYFPEIQGMRAIAVLAVVFAHANIPGFRGGFVGVDVFFVISGFLITRLLLLEIDRTGRIDLLAFWTRRAIRLLPNAYAALIGTVLLAVFVFPGYNPIHLAKEITLAAFQVANFHFAFQAVDYFQAEEAASPVLHFWSLNIEEQFYAVWPLLLLSIFLCQRSVARRNILIALGMIWAASFAVSVVLTNTESQPLAYFLTISRCWQLATGALLAGAWKAIEQLPASWRVRAVWSGLAAILAAVVLFDEGMLYPGLWALMPTIGAAALIAGFAAAPIDGALRKGLSHSLMQWIGARSYSWYLWHWPLLTLPRAALPESQYIEPLAVPASLAIACLAYSWIETPFRRSAFWAGSQRNALAAAGAGCLLVLAAGHGYPALLMLDEKAADRAEQLRRGIWRKDQAERDGCAQVKMTAREQERCLYGDRSAPRRAVLFGDSHAMHWFAALEPAAKETGWALAVWTKHGCPSANFAMLRNGHPDEPCRRWRAELLSKLTGKEQPELVILSNRTDYELYKFDAGQHNTLSKDAADELWRNGLRQTLQQLVASGTQVLLIQDVPRPRKGLKNCLLANEFCSTPRSQAVPAKPLDATVAAEFAGRIKVADFTDQICGPLDCPGIIDGIVTYQDATHITARYSETFKPQMVRLLHEAAERLPVATKPQAVAAEEASAMSTISSAENDIATMPHLGGAGR